jgi:predicted RNase H-like HicB family nuclease
MTKSYLVVFVKGKSENAGYMGYSPDVPRCVSTGDTAEEMRAMMKEALEFHLEGLLEDGEPIPEPHVTEVEFDPAVRDEVDHYLVEWLGVAVPTGIATSLSQRAAVPA